MPHSSITIGAVSFMSTVTAWVNHRCSNPSGLSIYDQTEIISVASQSLHACMSKLLELQLAVMQMVAN
jgi:hypothetical protein